MATLKQRLHKKNRSGTYDTVYLETSASMVLMEDGTTAQAAITGKAASLHNHGGQNINPSAVELNPGSGAGHGGYIDFHYNGDMASDYTARIIESAKGVLNVVGSLTQNDTAVSLNGHSHAASNITSGALGVARGGTGKASWTANRLVYPSASTTMTQLAFPTTAGSVLRQGTSGAPYWTSMDDLKTALGVSSSGGESGGSGEISGSTTAGSTMTFDNMSWIVVDNGAYNSNERVLILKDIWTLDTYLNMNSWCWYFYHFVLSAEARAKLTSHTVKANNIATISRKIFPVFLPSYDECNGGFTYFNSLAITNRIARYDAFTKNWWTRSGYDTDSMYCVKTDGNFDNYLPCHQYGFRPCVALAI